MKRHLLLVFLLSLTVTCIYSQDWINLEYPVSGIIGRPVDKIKLDRKTGNSSILWSNDIPWKKLETFDNYQSLESVVEYQNKFKKFTSKFFNTDKSKIKSVKAHNLVIRSLSQDDVAELTNNVKYVYEGIAADSVTITISVKKNSDVDISKIVSTAASIVLKGGDTTSAVSKIIPKLDSISLKNNDSIYYKSTIKNPDVYYKIRVAQVELLKPERWSNYCMYFYSKEQYGKEEDFPETRTLKLDDLDRYNKTPSRYPEFYGMMKDRKDLYYYFNLVGEKNNMDLVLYGVRNDTKGGEQPLDTIPYIVRDGKRIWRKKKYLVDRIPHKNRVKKVYIQIAARQIDEETVEIINWHYTSSCKNALTNMTYPEYRIRYKGR